MNLTLIIEWKSFFLELLRSHFVLVLGPHCPECFTGFPPPTDLIQIWIFTRPPQSSMKSYWDVPFIWIRYIGSRKKHVKHTGQEGPRTRIWETLVLVMETEWLIKYFVLEKWDSSVVELSLNKLDMEKFKNSKWIKGLTHKYLLIEKGNNTLPIRK